MIHPLIDITKPIRLTEYGERIFGQIEEAMLLEENTDPYPSNYRYPIHLKIKNIFETFTSYGKRLTSDLLPSIENYEPIKQESQTDKWQSVPDEPKQASPAKSTEIELTQVERMAWEACSRPNADYTIEQAFSFAQGFMDYAKKRR